MLEAAAILDIVKKFREALPNGFGINCRALAGAASASSRPVTSGAAISRGTSAAASLKLSDLRGLRP